VRFLRTGWPVVIPLYDARQCPECCALVAGKAARRAHESWHNELDEAVDGPAEAEDPGGFVVGGPGWSVAQITGPEVEDDRRK
jgi:hypothetical protein